jgi:DnaJ-class molecular chaperone
MSDKDNIVEPEAKEPQPTACMPCRGTGKVVSNLGGAPSVIDCPWCRGTGMRIVDIDAQSAWLGATEAAGAEKAVEPPE